MDASVIGAKELDIPPLFPELAPHNKRATPLVETLAEEVRVPTDVAKQKADPADDAPSSVVLF